MRDEASKIVSRRFMNRPLESGLLILAVALGVGAAASGLSLFTNALKAGKEMLASPAYREIVVSAQSSADEMAVPASLKSDTRMTILTSEELQAAGMAPDVVYSYISNEDELRLVNQASIERMAAMPMPGNVPSNIAAAGQTSAQTTSAQAGAQGVAAESAATAQGASGAQEGMPNGAVSIAPPDGIGGPGGRQMMSAEELAKAQASADVVMAEIERLKGYSVTPDFFLAWGMQAVKGSLFADSDLSGETKVIVLGSEAASTIAGNGGDASSLVGKKLLTWEGYKSIIGILAETGNSSYDQSFFSPYRLLTAGGNALPRMGGRNTQLKFTVSEPSRLARAESYLSDWFIAKYGTDQIAISNPRTEATKLIARNAGIGALILFLSLAALFIASVNISNILMGRGIRMKRNVGILMAMGASKNAILRLFASEAVWMAVGGSALGSLFALPLSNSMQNALGIEGGSWIFTLAGILVSSVLILLFSVVPAWQNSRQEPAEAMKSVS